MCRDCGGVRTLWNQLPAGTNAMHGVSHDLLSTAKLIRLGGEGIEAVLLIPACIGLLAAVFKLRRQYNAEISEHYSLGIFVS